MSLTYLDYSTTLQFDINYSFTDAYQRVFKIAYLKEYLNNFLIIQLKVHIKQLPRSGSIQNRFTLQFNDGILYLNRYSMGTVEIWSKKPITSITFDLKTEKLLDLINKL